MRFLHINKNTVFKQADFGLSASQKLTNRYFSELKGSHPREEIGELKSFASDNFIYN